MLCVVGFTVLRFLFVVVVGRSVVEVVGAFVCVSVVGFLVSVDIVGNDFLFVVARVVVVVDFGCKVVVDVVVDGVIHANIFCGRLGDVGLGRDDLVWGRVDFVWGVVEVLPVSVFL